MISMKTLLIDGKVLACRLNTQLKAKIGNLTVKPKLAIVQIGNNPESNSYVRAKKRIAEKLGIFIEHIQIKKDVSTKNLIQQVQKLGKDKIIHGVIVQLPLSEGLDTKQIITAVPISKDVDGFSNTSSFTPPVAGAVLEVLKATRSKLKEKNIVVIGRGITGGDMIIRTFNKLKIPHLVVHSQTEKPKKILKKADIIICAVGKPGTIQATDLKKGVILISVGISKDKDGLKGDYDSKDVEGIASYYTPTPGGIGPLTVHFLMHNVYEAARIY